MSSVGKKGEKEKGLFHVIHKVPSGNTPYVKAKRAQVVEKDAEKALVWFWKAINAGDKVDSALKDMVVVMKQLDRTEEAIEAIKSFRSLCTKNSQDSLDNLLIDLYKKCGRVEEQIEVIKKKLRLIYQGEAFNGRPTKTARSHGKKFQVTVGQEISRLLGNLGWAYMQKSNYLSAEVVYRKAQMIHPDAKKSCNLGLCLIRQGRYDEARRVLTDVLASRASSSDDPGSRWRAAELMEEIDSKMAPEPPLPRQDLFGLDDEDFVNGLERLMQQWAPPRSRRLPIFEEISSFKDQLVC